MFPVESSIGALASLVSLGIYIACGINGNRWREKSLFSRGYDQVDTVSAANREGAVTLYWKGRYAGELLWKAVTRRELNQHENFDATRSDR